MQIKGVPRVDTRYWTTISLASMCGANLGDVFGKDIFGFAPGLEISIFAAAFVVILLVDRLSPRPLEALYWMAILTVRAAATAIADASADMTDLNYVSVGAALAAILVGLVVLDSLGKPSEADYPRATGIYWLAMLAAGTLGTVLGDGVGHAFGSPLIGVPVSAAISTLALCLIFGLRAKTDQSSIASYWGAIVGFRWWGTNTGDILAHVITLTFSLMVTGLAIALLLLFWRAQPAERRPAMKLLSHRPQ